MTEHESLGVAPDPTYVDALVTAANHLKASWRMEGSDDWTKKRGRLTVWVELDEATWDEVYDRLQDGDVAL